ncbi:GGDEF domain-containing protein [Coxiella-like endosymbiont of Rhipicephalus sanguineus]|uniref:GGDEF domain-containing protein n=1 Tax=Coxiella-like endosymbiont of Rhipicephalus sanguineus TaxID=1955402 RepID=UPI00203CF38A|nr:GGDEF domain-containing protein [Coxiella-like endosymbiont of Rhipicephalus sanguineus]
MFEYTKSLSYLDPLTGIYNRVKLAEVLKKWKENSIQYTKKTVSIFLLDLNQFKTINDKYGHRKGDEVLKETCKSFVHSLEQEIYFFASVMTNSFTLFCTTLTVRTRILGNPLRTPN